MRKLPSLNAVRAFEAVARHRSFTAAANELCVTVAAVSHQIRHLEEVLEIKLFRREARTVSLTPDAERLLPAIRDGFDKLAEAFGELRERSAGAITVTATRAFAERWLMPRLARFSDSFPEIVVNVEASERVIDLRAGEADIAIRYGRAADPTLEASLLFEDVRIAVAIREICRDVDRPSIREFANRPLLAFRWKNKVLDTPSWREWLGEADPGRKGDFRISWFSEESLALQAAERGFGPLLCSDILVRDGLVSGCLRELEGPRLRGFPYRLLQLPSPARKRRVAAFADWLRAEAADFVAAGP